MTTPDATPAVEHATHWLLAGIDPATVTATVAEAFGVPVTVTAAGLLVAGRLVTAE